MFKRIGNPAHSFIQWASRDRTAAASSSLPRAHACNAWRFEPSRHGSNCNVISVRLMFLQPQKIKQPNRR
jgi:hypothetical protein